MTAIPVSFYCENPEVLRFIELHFQQGERVVGADVVHAGDFKDGVFKLKYRFEDTSPDLLVWRVYAIDKSFVEYKTIIK